MNNARNKMGRMAGILAITLVAVSITGCGSDEQPKALYGDLKKAAGVSDQMTEGEISSSMFGSTITVEKPELKLISNGGYGNARRMIEAFANTYQGALQNVNDSFSDASRTYMNYSIGREAAIYLTASSAEISSEGDKDEGKLDIMLKGISLRDPFVTEVSGEVVAAREISDEIRPADAPLDDGGRLIEKPHRFHENSLNLIPGLGNWIINATGAYGSTVDAHLVVERDSSGEGTIQLILTHYLDGSKIGSITRKAAFEEMPDLDAIVMTLGDLAKAFAIGGNAGKNDGAIGLAVVAESFARKAKASSYEISYDGYELLEKSLKSRGLSEDDKGFAAFCRQADIGYPGVLSKAKKAIDDSDCKIARSLIEDGGYREAYQFNADKTLFAELVVNSKYEVTIN